VLAWPRSVLGGAYSDVLNCVSVRQIAVTF